MCLYAAPRLGEETLSQAQVTTVPGYYGSNQDPEFLKAEADKIGYPVMIKAGTSRPFRVLLGLFLLCRSLPSVRGTAAALAYRLTHVHIPSRPRPLPIAIAIARDDTQSKVVVVKACVSSKRPRTFSSH